MNIIKRVIIFGGTDAAFYFACQARAKDLEVIFITDPFRLNSNINKEKTLRAALNEANIQFIETINIKKRDLISLIDNNTIGFSIVTLWIFKKEIIDLFKGHFYNYHGALLPDEKGGGTFTWKILRQNLHGGLSIHKIIPEIDEGPIVLEEIFTYPDTIKKPIEFELYRDKFEKKLLKQFLKKILINEIGITKEQSKSNNYYWPLLQTEINGVINWTWTGKEIKIFIDAFDDPYNGASTECKGKRIFIKDADFMKMDLKTHPFQNGLVLNKENKFLTICVKDGLLIIKKVIDIFGESLIDSIKLGDRLYSTNESIERSMVTRPIYDFYGIKKNILLHPSNNFIEMERINSKNFHRLNTINNNEITRIVVDETKNINLEHNINIKINLENYSEMFFIQDKKSKNIIGLNIITSNFVSQSSEFKVLFIAKDIEKELIESIDIIYHYCFYILKNNSIKTIVSRKNNIFKKTLTNLNFFEVIDYNSKTNACYRMIKT